MDYQITFRSIETERGIEYQALYATPNDHRWRTIRYPTDEAIPFDSAAEAEAAAGHALCAMLNIEAGDNGQ
jgi:hypothetical protein